MHSQPETLYFSYLIRLWRDHPDALWRISAQSVQSGKTLHFATIDALALFLREHKLSAPSDDSVSDSQHCQQGETS